VVLKRFYIRKTPQEQQQDVDKASLQLRIFFRNHRCFQWVSVHDELFNNYQKQKKSDVHISIFTTRNWNCCSNYRANV